METKKIKKQEVNEEKYKQDMKEEGLKEISQEDKKHNKDIGVQSNEVNPETKR